MLSGIPHRSIRPGGKVSYHIVQNSPYDLEALNSKARNGIKRGLENFRIENITFEQLAKDGWYLQEDTLMRQNRQGSMTRKDWEKLCMAAVGLPGFEVFAAFSGYNIAAATIVCNIDNIYSVPFAMSHCSYLRQHVNNALFYSMISDLQKRVNNKGIFFTVQSLDAPVNVDEFKIRMGLEPKVIRQHVAMHPLVRPFVSRPVHSLVDRLHNRYPASNILAKTEGIFRFYLEGKSEVSDQNLPEFLKDDARLSGNFAGI